MERPDFRNEPLGDMAVVGLVEAGAARIWLRSARPGRIAVSVWAERHPEAVREASVAVAAGAPADGTASVRLPAPDAPPLASNVRHRFRALHEDGRVLGEGGFLTAPADDARTPLRFAIGLGSCHQPFDAEGRIAPHTEPMLRAVRALFERHAVGLAFLAGDQMYADYPPRLSLFDADHFAHVAPPGRRALTDCTAAEVRRIYQRRYRHYWAVPGWQALQVECACLPILDDHEIVDNWGSAAAHREAGWQAVGEGARAAYADYQHTRVAAPSETPAPCFDYDVEYGAVAAHVMDLRSQRRWGEDGRVYGPEQEKALERFLERHAHRQVLLLVLSVPLVHLPPAAARLLSRASTDGEDFSDRWSTGEHVRDRDALLRRLHDHQRRHPTQRIVLLSGDIHIGCVHEIRWEDGTPPLYQLVSSGITHRVSRAIRVGSRIVIGTTRRVVTRDGRLAARVRTVRGDGRNPYGDLNVGLVELTRTRPGGRYELRFLLYGHRDGEPVCAFRSMPVA